MPDMQTALNKVLSSWNQPQPQPEIKPMNKGAHLVKFAPTNNVSRVTFDYIKQHPGLTGGEISRVLEKQGFKQGSTSSVITQLVLTNQARRDADRRLYILVDEYIPLKRNMTVKKAIAAAKAEKAAKVKKVAKVREPEIKAAADVDVNVDTLLSRMSIVQARAMYDALKKIFGA